MKPTRITTNELEANFELFIDRAAEGETFVFEYNGQDLYLSRTLDPPSPTGSSETRLTSTNKDA